MHNELKTIIEQAWENRALLQAPAVQQAVRQVVELVDKGELRTAEPVDPAKSEWKVNEWVKKAVILYFPIQPMRKMEAGELEWYDKMELKHGYGELGVRVVPQAVARYGAYNVILGHTADGEPIRLLSESVLNGTILMILATCTVSTFATQRGAHNIAMRNAQDDDKEPQEEDHILIPLANEQTAYELVCLSMTLKKAKERNGLYALNAIDNKVEDPNLEKQGRKLLDMAAQAAASADNYMQQLLRYDVNIANAIVSVVKERNISDIVMGMHHDRTPGGSGIGRMAADLLGYSNVTTFFYHPEQPRTTVKRHLFIVPEKAEKEAGFQLWMQKLRNLAENSSARIVFYAPASTMQYLRPSRGKRSSKAEYVVSDCWDDLTALTYETKRDDCLWVVMSRRDRLSYHPAMSKVPGYMEQFFAGHSFVLIYPVQAGDTDNRYL